MMMMSTSEVENLEAEIEGLKKQLAESHKEIINELWHALNFAISEGTKFESGDECLVFISNYSSKGD